MIRFAFTIIFLCLQFGSHVFAIEESAFEDEEQIKKFLLQKEFKLDPAAAAIYLEAAGKVIASYSERNFYYEYEVKKMAKIITEQGMDVTDVVVNLSPGQTITKVKAITYNLINGRGFSEKVNDKPLETVDIGKGKRSRISFKNVKAGSIIYYTYTIKAAGNMILPAWNLKEKYPVLHSSLGIASEYGIEFLVYNNLGHDFTVATANDIYHCASCRYADAAPNVNTQFRTAVWASNNLPALKYAAGIAMEPEEYLAIQLKNLRNLKYLGNANNNAYGSATRAHEYMKDYGMNNWEEVNNNILYGGKNFGAMLERETSLIENTAKELTGKIAGGQAKARSIFAFVRDSIRTEDAGADMYAYTKLHEVLKSRSGNHTEKSLLLVSLLRAAGLQADPVALIRGHNESMHTDFPNYAALNYCIVQFRENGNTYYLDPDTAMPFGLLHADCSERSSFLVNKKGGFVFLPEAPRNRNVSFITMKPGTDPAYTDFALQVNLSALSSVEFRKALMQAAGTPDKEQLKKAVAGYLNFTPEYLEGCGIGGLGNIDSSLMIQCSGRYKTADLFRGGLFDPYFIKLSGRREGTPQEHIYTLNFSLPRQYAIKNLPEPKNLRFGDNVMTYSSNAIYNPEQQLFQLSYTYTEHNKSLDTYSAEDLQAFFSGIRQSQEQPVQVSN